MPEAERGQNPVKFSLNCFLAILFMEIPEPAYACGLGRAIYVEKNVGMRKIELGLSNYFVYLEQRQQISLLYKRV